MLTERAASNGFQLCIQLLMIKKTPKGYVLLSKTTGKKLGGPYKSREQALKRERQVQFFKHRKAG
jgi:hypothetical protein